MHVVGIGSLVVVLAVAGARLDAAPARARGDSIKLEAEEASLHPDRAEIVQQTTFPSKRGVSLREGVSTNVGSPETQPDLVFKAKAPRAGRYWIRTHAATDAKGAEAMRRAAAKTASLRLMISVGDTRPTKRVVFVPWSDPGSCAQATGKFDFTGEEQQIRVWLPEGVRLDYLQISPYTPPKVPPAAAAYRPAVVPPASRPRIVAVQPLAHAKESS
jgi:heparin/heparan-sulfate lyase